MKFGRRSIFGFFRRFAGEGIKFAYSTTTMRVKGTEAARRGELAVVTEDARYGPAT